MVVLISAIKIKLLLLLFLLSLSALSSGSRWAQNTEEKSHTLQQREDKLLPRVDSLWRVGK